MKSYLGLVAEYARVHKKKNRLTIICIAISVMLMVAVFGMADMSVRAQIDGYIKHNGNYHAILSDISEYTAQQIANRDDINISGWTGWAEDTVYAGRELLVQGGEQAIAAEMTLTVIEGAFPQTEHEALLDRRGLEQFGLAIGDTIAVPLGSATHEYRISGVFGDFPALMRNDAHGLFLNVDGIRALDSAETGKSYYIQFKRGVNIRRALTQIKAEYGLNDGQVSENTRLLGMMGQSDDSAMWQLYISAGILFVLVTAAGVFMIAGSFNMSVLERTQFFGLLRCLGASKKQIKRYIRLEGLRYCLKGIPLGLLTGCVTAWACAFILNAIDLGDKQPHIPLFQISLPGVAAGVAIGFLVVMIASRAPAKRAAAVSPQAAVTGNLNCAEHQYIGTVATNRFNIDTAMGFHHAFSNRKNTVLTAGSIALSIIMFLSFTVLIDFMNHAVKPLKPYAPDISVMTAGANATLDRALFNELKALPHIKQIYGRMLTSGVQANETAVFVSYDAPQFRWAAGMLSAGSVSGAENGDSILIDYKKAARAGLVPGDTVTINIHGKPFDFPVAGVLSHAPFSAENDEFIAICSEATFTKMTGVSDYTIIDMQLTQDISAQVREVIPADVLLLDEQQSNRVIRAAYYAMAVFVYGFLFVIALIALINIINIINAGVSRRINNYGVMRAVGMSGGQLKKIITAETAAYAVTGCVAGSVLGLLLNKLFFSLMITSNWGEIWNPPLLILAVIILATVLTALIAVISPTKKIKEMSIVDVVNAG